MPRDEPLTEFVDRARAAVDDALERWLPKPPACPPLVSEAMRYSVFAGGKRLRPLLALAAADAVERLSRHSSPLAEPPASAKATARLAEVVRRRHPPSLALPAACAVELIHTYSLIHDDLPAMDNDTLRRGRPTLHVAYGDGMAILAGDGLQAEAFALMAREPDTTDPALLARKLRVVRIVADAAGPTGMVGGQAIDLQAAGQAPGHTLSLDADGLRAMHLRKTGALIRASAVSGAIMGGADPGAEQAIADWGAQIGLAFQIVDDILDVEGSVDRLGKSTGKDAAGDKPSYPRLFGLDRSRAMAAECAERAHAVLDSAKLTGSHLDALANWVISRDK